MQVCVVGGGNQRRLPGEGKTGATLVKAALSGEERRLAESQNGMCESARTRAPRRGGGLGKILRAPHPPQAPPRGQLSLRSTPGGKATGPGRNESQSFHHRGALQCVICITCEENTNEKMSAW